MKNKGWSSKFPFFSSVPLVNSNEYKLPQKNRCRIQRKKLVRNAREDMVRSSCKSSLLITWENISIWCVPQSIPFHGEKTGDIKNAQHFTKMGNRKNTWQPCYDLKNSHKSINSRWRQLGFLSLQEDETMAHTVMFFSLPQPNYFSLL